MNTVPARRLRGAARGFVVGVAAVGLAGPAGALVVESDPAEVQRSPGPGMGFEHVGKIGGTTGVYLGDGWMLTAGHVGAGDVWLDGATYAAVAGSWTQLRGPEGGSPPDLGVFRVSPHPPLPPLEIARRKPAVGDPLVLVGCGHGGGEHFEWEGRTGIRWAPPNVRRWGTNRVAAVGIDLPTPGASTRVFGTLFSAGQRQEAQAALGDSGGAGFVHRRRTWLLAGIMISVVTHPGQPPQTAVDGNATHFADLSHYRDAILVLTRGAGAPSPRPRKP